MMKLNHIGLLAEDCQEAVRHINSMLGELDWEYFDFFFPQETVNIGKQFHIKTASPTSDRWISRSSSPTTERVPTCRKL